MNQEIENKLVKKGKSHLVFFIKNMKALRIKASISQKELADRIGVHPSHVSGMELGRVMPSLPHCVSIAKELGVTIEAMTSQEWWHDVTPEMELSVSKSGRPPKPRKKYDLK